MDSIEMKIEAVLKKQLDNESLIEMYYEIGNLIRTYNSKQLKILVQSLKQKYGVVIAFTERNFVNMIHFSLYKIELLPALKKITWKNHLVILKQNDESLIDLCLEYKPTKYELVQYIKNKKPLKKHQEIELDDTLEELLQLQKELRR